MPQEVTGTQILRDAMKARKKSSAAIARELAIPSDHMSNFIAGTRTLPPDTLRSLATYLFNGAVEYVPALDLLRTTNTTPPTTMAAYPPRFDPSKQPKLTIPTRGPQPVKPVPPPPKAKRAGWVK